ncbi:hypothetical protein B484DRAFT_297350, partial [Ochromonadaceae sp. CCMP2298]
SQRTRHKLLRAGILPPRLSSWAQLLNYGDTVSFLDVTGFTRHAFMALETALLRVHTVPVKGSAPALNFRGQIGLYLFYLGSRMNLKHLCLLFGIFPPTASEIILKMMTIVVQGLSDDRHGRVKWPTEVEMEEYAQMVFTRSNSQVANVIAMVDGLAIPCECTDDPLVQNAYFNGYYHDTAVNNVFAFSPTGKIIYACINARG